MGDRNHRAGSHGAIKHGIRVLYNEHPPGCGAGLPIASPAGLFDDLFGLIIREMVLAPEPHRLGDGFRQDGKLRRRLLATHFGTFWMASACH